MARRMWRGRAVTVACMTTALAAPGSAVALTTHSVTATAPNSAGVLVATAKCGANEHVVSGGFKSHDFSSAIVSRAVEGNSWTVHLYPESPPLTTYAYCAPNGQFSLSRHIHKVRVSRQGVNTTASARCASGERVASGGYVMGPPSATDANSPNYKNYATSAGRWTVMSVFAQPPGNLVAFVYCTRGVSVKVRSSSKSIPAKVMSNPGAGSTTARCHRGETLLSGGYTTTPKPDWMNATGPDFFYNASHRSGQRAWTARSINFSAVSGKLTAFAYCAP
ncbi:MAG TPA: hypothetical protein VGL78_06235 [Solirubrobacteraceae bacterium]